MEYRTATEGPTVTYRNLEEGDFDYHSFAPDLGISINGSAFVSVKHIIQMSMDMANLARRSSPEKEKE
jgi:hypothetical protein